MLVERLKDLPSPLAILLVARHTIRQQERLDRLGSEDVAAVNEDVVSVVQ